MLTTVLFDMGGTLEDIWNNEQTRSEVMTRLAPGAARCRTGAGLLHGGV